MDNFSVIRHAFLPNNIDDISKHAVIIKNGKKYNVLSKSDWQSQRKKEKKIPQAEILQSLFKAVKKSEASFEEVMTATLVTKYFSQKTSISTACISKISRIVSNLFLRFGNLIKGYGFATNQEMIAKIQARLKVVKIEGQTFRGFIPVDFWASMKSHRPPTTQIIVDDPYVKIAEKNFKQFCNNVTGSKQVMGVQLLESPSIPEEVHLVWLGSTPPQKVLDIAEAWKKHNLGWKVTIWTQDKISNELFPQLKAQYPNISTIVEQVYAEADTYAEKADVARLVALFLKGGVYGDANDMECLRSFRQLHRNGVTFYAGLEDNKTTWKWNFYLCNALMGAAPKHEVIEHCLLNLKPLSSGEHILERTGPVVLSEGCKKALDGKNKDGILVLPCSYIYPLPFSEDAGKLSREYVHSNYVEPETLAIHYWEGSWKKPKP
jgi:hypothetical protein